MWQADLNQLPFCLMVNNEWCPPQDTPLAYLEFSSSQFYSTSSWPLLGYNYCRHLWNKILLYLFKLMFTLILQSILQDSNRWADVGKNLIDETPFVWPVLTNETKQDNYVQIVKNIWRSAWKRALSVSRTHIKFSSFQIKKGVKSIC